MRCDRMSLISGKRCSSSGCEESMLVSMAILSHANHLTCIYDGDDPVPIATTHV